MSKKSFSGLTPFRKTTLHSQEVKSCMTSIRLHRQTLLTLAGWMTLQGEESQTQESRTQGHSPKIDAGLVWETGRQMTVEINQMNAWIERLEKVALGDGHRPTEK